MLVSATLVGLEVSTMIRPELRGSDAGAQCPQVLSAACLSAYSDSGTN